MLVRRTTKTKELLVALVTTSDAEMEKKADLMSLVEEIKALDLSAKLCGVIHIINDGMADVVQSDETRVLYGQEYVYEELLGLKFKISVFSFSRLIHLERKFCIQKQENISEKQRTS